MSGTPEECHDYLKESIKQKRIQLSTMKKESNRRAMNGRHTWGDYNAKLAIKELENEILELKKFLK